MALRIDFFSVEPGHDLEREDLSVYLGEAGHHPDAPVRWEGHVSAADADEASLTELAGHWGEHGVLDGVTTQGVTDEPRPVTADAAAVLGDVDALGVAEPDAQVREWAGVVSHCVSTTVASDRHLGWWTRYDVGGTVDAGAEEWTTGSSLRGTG